MSVPSDAFKEAFSDHCGGCRRTCSCGRTHFDGYNSGYNSWYTWDDGEFEELESLNNADPDKTIRVQGVICTYTVSGKQYVWDCPCGGGAKEEQWIQHHAFPLARFLNAMVKEAEDEAKKAQDLRVPEVLR